MTKQTAMNKENKYKVKYEYFNGLWYVPIKETLTFKEMQLLNNDRDTYNLKILKVINEQL